MRLSLTRLVVASALACAGLLFAAVSARAAVPPGLGISLTPDSSTPAGGDPRLGVYVANVVAPGAVLTRKFQVTNGTDKALSVDLYPDAASIAQGVFTPAAGQTGNELTGWTRVTPDHTRVPAGGTVSGTVTITVPKDAARGERYGVVLAQYTGPSSGGTIRVARVGIRMYLFVGDGTDPSSGFTVTSVERGTDIGGVPTVAVGVVNTGQRALDLLGRTEFDGPEGRHAGPVVQTSASTLAPGERSQLTFAAPDEVKGGPWRVGATVTAGQLTHIASASLTFPGTLGERSVSWWAIVLAILALLLVLFLFAATWRTLRQARATAIPAEEPAGLPTPAARGAALPRR